MEKVILYSALLLSILSSNHIVHAEFSYVEPNKRVIANFNSFSTEILNGFVSEVALSEALTLIVGSNYQVNLTVLEKASSPVSFFGNNKTRGEVLTELLSKLGLVWRLNKTTVIISTGGALFNKEIAANPALSVSSRTYWELPPIETLRSQIEAIAKSRAIVLEWRINTVLASAKLSNFEGSLEELLSAIIHEVNVYGAAIEFSYLPQSRLLKVFKKG